MNRETEPGLDLFAAAWLDTWKQLGGTLYISTDPQGVCHIGQPEPGEKQAAADHIPTLSVAAHLQFRNAAEWQGAMKAMEILRARTPGATDAIKQHARYWPEVIYRDWIMA